MFLENKELCYSFNVEICIFVLWHKIKRSKREKFNEPIFSQKSTVWEKIDIPSGRVTQKKMLKLSLRKYVAIIAKYFPFYIY